MPAVSLNKYIIVALPGASQLQAVFDLFLAVCFTSAMAEAGTEIHGKKLLSLAIS